MHFWWNSTIFRKHHNQLVAQYSFLFVVRSSTCFGQIYQPSSGSYKQHCVNWKLCHVVTTAVVFTIIKILRFVVCSWRSNYNKKVVLCNKLLTFFVKVKHVLYRYFRKSWEVWYMWYMYIFMHSMHEMTQYCAGGKIEKNEMGGACGAYGGGERCAHGSDW